MGVRQGSFVQGWKTTNPFTNYCMRNNNNVIYYTIHYFIYGTVLPSNTDEVTPTTTLLLTHHTHSTSCCCHITNQGTTAGNPSSWATHKQFPITKLLGK